MVRPENDVEYKAPHMCHHKYNLSSCLEEKENNIKMQAESFEKKFLEFPKSTWIDRKADVVMKVLTIDERRETLNFMSLRVLVSAIKFHNTFSKVVIINDGFSSLSRLSQANN